MSLTRKIDRVGMIARLKNARIVHAKAVKKSNDENKAKYKADLEQKLKEVSDPNWSFAENFNTHESEDSSGLVGVINELMGSGEEGKPIHVEPMAYSVVRSHDGDYAEVLRNLESCEDRIVEITVQDYKFLMHLLGFPEVVEWETNNPPAACAAEDTEDDNLSKVEKDIQKSNPRKTQPSKN